MTLCVDSLSSPTLRLHQLQTTNSNDYRIGRHSSHQGFVNGHQLNITRLPSEQVSLAEHDNQLTRPVLAIRRDLRVRPGDNAETFSFHLIAPHLNESSPVTPAIYDLFVALEVASRRVRLARDVDSIKSLVSYFLLCKYVRNSFQECLDAEGF